MKKHAILILAAILSINFTFAQDPDKSLEARLSVIHNKQSGEIGPLMAIGVTFINKSDKDIYIPEILKFSKDQSHFAVTSFKKKGSAYKPFSYTKNLLEMSRRLHKSAKKNQMPGTVISGTALLTSDINWRIKEIDDKHIAAAKHYIESNNLPIDTNMFTGYENHALFLKAGEEIRYYYTIELRSAIYKEGEYIFEFKPDFTKTVGEGYPDTFMGYTKLVPTAVESNRIYLNLKGLDK